MVKSNPSLKPNTSPGATVTALQGDAWGLTIPPGPKGRYRLAQLDDYSVLRRRTFPWRPPLVLALRARASTANIPGTWGFGLWNDPFSLSLGFGGGTRRFPALPNAVWFFFASPHNYLSFRDDLPAQGFLAQTFNSPPIPAPLLALGGVGFPMLAWPRTARWIRSLVRYLIQEDSCALPPDVTRWHAYSLEWREDRVTFMVDGEPIFETAVSPKASLGLVLWIDNQYAALPPNGRLSYGTLASQVPAWIEIDSISVTHRTR